MYCQQLLLDITQDHNLSQTVFTQPIFTNFPALIQNMQVISGLSDHIISGLSDHDIVIIESKTAIS